MLLGGLGCHFGLRFRRSFLRGCGLLRCDPGSFSVASFGWGIGVQRGCDWATWAFSGLDVDSNDGCSDSVAGSRVGVSNSVFRVMLSGSGLRTFDIAWVPEFLAAAINLADCGGFRAAIAASGDALGRYPCHRNSRRNLWYLLRDRSTRFNRAGITRIFPWTIPGSLRLAGGGRNLLLESAQEATLISVSTSGFQRQCNTLANLGWELTK